MNIYNIKDFTTNLLNSELKSHALFYKGVKHSTPAVTKRAFRITFEKEN